MKRTLFLLALATLFACNPADQPGPNNNNQNNQGNNQQDPNGGGGGNGGGATDTGVDPTTLPAEAWFSTNFWDRTDAQKWGLRGKVKSLVEKHYNEQDTWEYTQYMAYEFDEAGRLTKLSDLEKDRPDNSVIWTFTYDAAGHLTKTEKRYQSYPDDVDCRYEFAYDNPGKRVAYYGDDWGLRYSVDNSLTSWYSLDLVSDLSYVKRVRFVGSEYEQVMEYTYTFDASGNLTREENDGNSVKSTGATYKDGYPYSSIYIKSSTWYNNGLLAEKVYNGTPGETFTYYDNPRVWAPKGHIGDHNGFFADFYWDCTYDENWDQKGRRGAYWEEEQIPPEEGVTLIIEEKDGKRYVINTDAWTDYKYDAHGNWIFRKESIEPIAQPSKPSVELYRRTIEYYQ